jgi:DedD protein
VRRTEILRFFMATPSMTVEEIQLRRRARHRLIGAVTLVTLLVVFLPMILDSEPKPVAEDIAINIPSQDVKPVITGVVPPQEMAPPPHPAPDDVTTPSAKLSPAPAAQPLTILPGGQAIQASPPPAGELKPAPVAADKVSAPPVKPAAALSPAKKPPAATAQAPREIRASPPAAEKARPAAPKEDGFVVRLGAFSNPENARRLEARLASMGVRHYSDVLKTASGDRHRVRAGPYATRREAETVRIRLKAVDMDGDIVAKP